MKTTVILSLIFMMSINFNAWSKDSFKFRTMSPPGGFSYDGVIAVQQDMEGFIWILLAEELYRFDGYTYKRHRDYFTNFNPRLEWSFSAIATDTTGVLYISTNNGLFRYNRNTDAIESVWHRFVEAITIDTKNNLWIKEKGAWGRFIPGNHQLEIPLNNGQPVSFLSNIHCFYNDDLYFFSNYGRIYRYNYTTDAYELCTILPGNDKRVIGAKAFRGKLWILVDESILYKLDLVNFSVEAEYTLWESSANFAKRAFYIDKTGCIWIGTINGLYIFDPTDNTTRHYEHSESNQYSIPNNSIWTINHDHQNNIWLGTYSGALCYVNLNEQYPFETFLPHDNQLNHAPVSAFAEDKHFLWVGTEGGGLNQINKQTGEFKYFTTDTKQTPLSSNNIKSLLIDKSQNLWIGTYTGGIDQLNLSNLKIRNFKSSSNTLSLRNNNIRKMIPDNDSGFWVAYQQRKLEISFFSYATEKFTHYDFSEQLKNAYIFDIIRRNENQLWILTKEKLFMLDTTTKQLHEIEQVADKFMNYNTFCLDDSGNLWIGTIGNGLVNYNPNTNEMFIHDKILQHNVSAISNICHDEEGSLWIGTDNGLITYNTKTHELFHYDKNDGVQGQVYYPLATMKGLNGKIYIGGTNGFTLLEPHKISINRHKPTVIISEFYIDYKPANPAHFKQKNTNELRLNYTQNNFGFKFSSDNYLMPEKTYFKYRLKGYDDRWIEVDATNRTAFYAKVPPGVYFFEVMAANNDGVWNEIPASLKIIRIAAPWFSWPAYLVYFILVAFISLYILKHYRDRKKLELQLYLENVEKEKKDAIHQSQLRFFTNISHDFRTPLSLIIASLDNLRQEGLKEYYYRILHSNANRLLNLVNELMDFRTIQNGKMKLELSKLNISQLVGTLGSDFIDYARKKDIQFTIKYDNTIPELVYGDKNIIEKIIMNLLINAFKYTEEGGQITLQTHLENTTPPYENTYMVSATETSKKVFNISIYDSGVGISKESIETVFERFYKVNTANKDSHLGTGIGLALVKSLVMLHKGTIAIASERGKGTAFTVSFPLDKEEYDAECFIEPSKAETESNEKQQSEEPTFHEDSMITSQSKKRILLVEDNTELRTMIADYLSVEYETIEAEDGKVATEILGSKFVDLIISDIMMPNKDGMSLCKELKQNIETSHIPVVLLTAKSGVESKLEGADSGADYYFEKPVSLELLKMNIQNIFRQQQQLKEFYAKNHFAESAELTSNDRDAAFLRKFVEIIEQKIDQPDMDVMAISAELSMSRSKLYRKIKSMTDMSIVEFILNYKLQKAARMIIEEDMTMREIMDVIGIESQPYFTNAFKKKFGETPTSFASRHKKNKQE